MNYYRASTGLRPGKMGGAGFAKLPRGPARRISRQRSEDTDTRGGASFVTNRQLLCVSGMARRNNRQLYVSVTDSKAPTVGIPATGVFHSTLVFFPQHAMIWSRMQAPSAEIEDSPQMLDLASAVLLCFRVPPLFARSTPHSLRPSPLPRILQIASLIFIIFHPRHS